MRTPTPEQLEVLNNRNGARIRVVRAAPGSGKTWLVAELIQKELSKWSVGSGGIAALSFTRVGGEEIRKALGYELAHPHFVGTIDAFLFRYVVRPFLRCCFPTFGAPRLIPGEWGAENWGYWRKTCEAAVGKGINLFGCVFIDEEQGRAVVAHKPQPWLPLQRLGIKDANAVNEGKRRLWERAGLLTHSDAALWASKVLGHPAFGAVVRAEIIRRFPLLIVDELQDTGFFLGKSIQLLLGETSAHGVVVGDPDQAIYEFNGARPELFSAFESIPGAASFPLQNSRRCPPAVAIAAGHLKESGGGFQPAQDKNGRSILVRFGDMVPDVRTLVEAMRAKYPEGSIRVITRWNRTVADLVGRGARHPPKLGCPALNHMHRAVVAFRQGRQVAALAAACAALELVLLGHEGVDDTELETNGVEPSRWRALAVRCVMLANSDAGASNLYDWQERIGHLLDSVIVDSGLSVARQHVVGRLRPKRKRIVQAERAEKTKKRKKTDPGLSPCLDYLPQPGADADSLRNVSVQTVHAVKGETHRITVLVCADPRKEADCPSAAWWSTNEKHREEKRVIYVAMTRTEGDLVVCVSDRCYQRLAQRHTQFVSSFECMTVDQFVSDCALAPPPERARTAPMPLGTSVGADMTVA